MSKKSKRARRTFSEEFKRDAVNLVLMFLLYVCGVIDLVYAKMPLRRHRVFASFGPSQIPAGRRDAYFRGYKRLLLGAAFNVLVLVHYAVMAGST